jgi:hypothetical protein
MTTPPFDGETFDATHDGPRLSRQLDAVRDLMRDGVWRTLSEIVAAIGSASEAGASARLRDCRKREFGGHTVNRRRRGDPKTGLWEYQLILNTPTEATP